MEPVESQLIAHFDLDSFFVSVEVLKDPSLRGKPVIVGGRERGVVAACSYEARASGIHSAMPMRTALTLCPNAIVVSGSRGEYSRYSRWVTDIIASKAPLFEKASIDEFYIDLSGMEKYHRPFEWTVGLREEIIEKTRLPISFGLAANKMVAKMATNEAKPNGYLHIPAGMERDFLAPLKVNKIPGVGDHLHQLLNSWGIQTIGELAAWPSEILEARLGKYGAELFGKAHGVHRSEVVPYYEAKSISTESTFEQNLLEEGQMLEEIVQMTEKVAFSLRQENKMAGCIAVKVRYPDFETTSRQTTLNYTCYDDELIPQAKELFRRLYRKGSGVRLLGVRLSELTDGAVQTNLFSDIGKKSELYRAIDGVKERFGENLLTKATGKRSSQG